MIGITKKIVAPLLLGAGLLVSGCGTNPVTGKQELQLVSEDQEISIGKQQYLPTQQGSGGQFKADPELTAYINQVGQKLAKVSHRPNLPFEFTIVDNDVPNAWALPGGKVAINWGLLTELHDEAELAAVLGHEITHATARHGAQGMERGILANVGMLALQVGLAASDIDQTAASVAVGSAALGATLVTRKYGRDAELEADHYGISYMVKAGYDPMAAVRLQETFVRLMNGKNPSFLEGLFATHPPSQERVNENRKLAQQYVNNPPKGGWYTGKKTYQQHIAKLRKVQEAEKDVKKGYDALKDNSPIDALAYADRAARKMPSLAAPYALKAAAYNRQGKSSQAMSAINTAIGKNDRFYSYYEQRAALKLAKGDKSGARMDLSRSTALLPTSYAHNILGQLAMQDGDDRTAIRHFQLAANDKGKIGQSAQANLVKLDLPQNPGRYLQVSPLVTNQGQLVLRVQNRSAVTLRDATFVIRVAGVGQTAASLKKPLSGGRYTDLYTSLGPVTPLMAQGAQIQVRNIRVGN